MKGLYLVERHGEMIFTGEKTAIVKAREFPGMLGIKAILISGKYAYGYITLTDYRPISIKEFQENYPRHRVTEAERLDWWGSQEPLYLYEFDFEPFEEPKPLKKPLPVGIQVWIDDAEQYVEGL